MSVIVSRLFLYHVEAIKNKWIIDKNVTIIYLHYVDIRVNSIDIMLS